VVNWRTNNCSLESYENINRVIDQKGLITQWSDTWEGLLQILLRKKLQPTNYLDIQKLADIQEFDNERIVGKICNK